MSNLIDGVRVYFAPDTYDGRARIWLSPGIVPVDRTKFRSLPYRRGALLPQEPWKEADDTEKALLITSMPLEPEDTVSILKLPAHLVESLKVKEREVDSTGWERLDTALKRYLTSSSDLTIAGLSVHLISARPTTTVDRVTNLFVGLHLDSWDGLPLMKRRHATNRICVNLGDEDRFFLFVNISASNLLRMCAAEHEDMGPHELIALFLQEFPTYPVVKVRVSPGEAYIAPTENILHDGANSNVEDLDITYTIRGHFDVRNGF